MGILLNAAYLMMVEGKRKAFSGSVLQLGRQSVLFDYTALSVIAAHAGFVLDDTYVDTARSRMTDVEFFHSIGFDDVLSMEYGTEENADFVWDMNYPIQSHMKDRFDFIYDGGTVEHIFNVPTCLVSICQMLKLGGRIMHDSAASGVIDHGFYSIQPTLYYDFYTAQGFETNLFVVSKIDLRNWLQATGEQAIYTPGMYDFEKTWALDANCVFNSVSVATKQKPFEQMVVPQQSLWARAAKKPVAKN